MGEFTMLNINLLHLGFSSIFLIKIAFVKFVNFLKLLHLQKYVSGFIEMFYNKKKF